MNILLVNNIASYHSNIANSLNNIKGVNAKYIVYENHKYINSNSHQIILKKYPSRKNPFKYVYEKITYKQKIRKWIEWCDVVYYIWDNILDEYDLEFAHKLNKKIYVEWVGSDIRNPEILFKYNPYYKEIFDKGYNYAELERSNFKNIVQEKFAKYNAKIFCCPEMSLYIRKDIFPNYTIILKKIEVSKIKSIPFIEKDTIDIIHSPSAPEAKGSHIIKEVVFKLKSKYNNINFQLLTDLPRNEVLHKMTKCDIFIDQIIIGAYGMASVEAMSYGKPVVCYLLPQLFDQGLPKECPIVNANPDNLYEKLEELILNPQLRKEIGEKSRKYVENYHDADKIALDLVKIFKQEDE